MKKTLAYIFRKILNFIVWVYLMVIPIYGTAMPREVAARAGIIWIALVLAVMYEFKDTKAECWGNWCEWEWIKRNWPRRNE